MTKEHIPIGRLNKPKSHVSEMSVIHVRVAAVGAVVAVVDAVLIEGGVQTSSRHGYGKIRSSDLSR